MDREACTWADCGQPAIAMTSTSGFEDAWVCEELLDEAILRDPDREVWRIYDSREATG